MNLSILNVYYNNLLKKLLTIGSASIGSLAKLSIHSLLLIFVRKWMLVPWLKNAKKK